MRKLGIVVLGIILIIGFGMATSLFKPAKRTLKVGVVPEESEFCSGEGGFAGIDVEFARSLSGLLGFDVVEFIAVKPAEAKGMLDSGEIDLYVGPAIRGGLVYFRGVATVVVRARDTPLGSVEDLEGRVMAVPEGSFLASWARRHLLAEGIISDLREYRNVRDAIVDLRLGRVQALLIWQEAVQFVLEGQPLANYLSLDLGADRVVLGGNAIDSNDLGRAVDQIKSSDEWFNIINGVLHLR